MGQGRRGSEAREIPWTETQRRDSAQCFGKLQSVGMAAQQRGLGDEGGTKNDKGLDRSIEKLRLQDEKSIK